MGWSPRAVGTFMLLVLAAGRVSTVAGEFSCLDALNWHSADTESVASESIRHCQETATQLPADVARVAARPPHDLCDHDESLAPSVVTSKSQFQTTLRAGEVAMFGSLTGATSSLSAQSLREHTPPGLYPAPIVRLRI